MHCLRNSTVRREIGHSIMCMNILLFYGCVNTYSISTVESESTGTKTLRFPINTHITW